MKTLLMDRDGTIIVDKNYLSDPQYIEVIDGVIDSLKKMKTNDFQFFIITNQSGVGRGYFKMQEVHEIHKELDKIFARDGIFIKEYLICPHAPNVNCQCRKPKTGLFKKIKSKYNIDTENTWMIGDKESDIEFGERIGVKTLYIQSSDTTLDNHNNTIICNKFSEILDHIKLESDE